MSIEGNGNGSNRWLNVPLVQMVLAAVLGAGGYAGLDLTKNSDYLDTKVYYEVNKECQKYYADAIDRITNREMVELRKDLHADIDKVKAMIPPKKLRDRILSIEDYLKSQEKGYKVPTYDWTD